jgi:hypothetical protein
MDLYQLAWQIGIGGTILIVLSWDGTVRPEVGWVGFVIALIGRVTQDEAPLLEGLA